MLNAPPACPATAAAAAAAWQVGEGNSFRREQRERYAAAGGGVHNMTSLAHATEEELLASAELQVG